MFLVCLFSQVKVHNREPELFILEVIGRPTARSLAIRTDTYVLPFALLYPYGATCI
jgi:hypothetical protein